MKKLYIFVLLLVLTTGCTRIDNNNDYKSLVDSNLTEKKYKVNTATTGYKFYLPKGVRLEKSLNFNQVFDLLDTKMYMYVDIVSYYYKNKTNNTSDKTKYNYYFENIENKNGYLGINEEDNKYFVKIVIDYASIEAYTTKNNLQALISYATLILNNVDYNDKLIEKYINDEKISSNDILYNIEKPENSESKFNQYLQEYVDEEDQITILPDE